MVQNPLEDHAEAKLEIESPRGGAGIPPRANPYMESSSWIDYLQKYDSKNDICLVAVQNRNVEDTVETQLLFTTCKRQSACVSSKRASNSS